MKRACVIGWPIEHSRSPLIHGHWLRENAIDGAYEKVAVEPENLREFLTHLRENGFAGCNVTVPHKEAAFKIAEHIEPEAHAVGAANTLWLDDAGRLCATNTDTYGFMQHLQNEAPNWHVDAKRPVAILGAGGAARAIAYGFQQAGVRDIHVYNRTFERAQALRQALGNEIVPRQWAERTDAPRDCAVVVNSTIIGMKGEGNLGLDFNNAHDACIAYDIVYVPLETEFLARAKNRGLRTIDGLGMLLHQAVPGFEKWFGVRPRVTRQLRDVVLADI